MCSAETHNLHFLLRKVVFVHVMQKTPKLLNKKKEKSDL